MAEFQRTGYQELSIQQISVATQLGKASLYHHFPGGKEEMALEVLLEMQLWLDLNIIEPMAGDGTLTTRLHNAFEHLTTFYDCGRKSCLLELMTSGDAPPSLREQANNSMKTLLSAFARIAREAGRTTAEAREIAEATLVALQGALIVARVTSDSAAFERQFGRLEHTFFA